MIATSFDSWEIKLIFLFLTGLFSVLMREQANLGGDNPKWIVLDGDIDPMWIESLNTVMDDNKVFLGLLNPAEASTFYSTFSSGIDLGQQRAYCANPCHAAAIRDFKLKDGNSCNSVACGNSVHQSSRFRLESVCCDSFGFAFSIFQKPNVWFPFTDTLQVG